MSHLDRNYPPQLMQSNFNNSHLNNYNRQARPFSNMMNSNQGVKFGDRFTPANHSYETLMHPNAYDVRQSQHDPRQPRQIGDFPIARNNFDNNTSYDRQNRPELNSLLCQLITKLSE